MRIKKFVALMFTVFWAMGSLYANAALETHEELVPISGPDYWYGAEKGPFVAGSNVEPGLNAASEEPGDFSVGEGSEELAAALEVEDVTVPDAAPAQVTIDQEAGEKEEAGPEEVRDSDGMAEGEAVEVTKTEEGDEVPGPEEPHVEDEAAEPEAEREAHKEGDQESGIEAVIKKEIAEKLDEVTEALSPIINQWVNDLGKHIKMAIKQWASTIQELVSEEEPDSEQSQETNRFTINPK